ncbi:substrate-binding periplasmic protein [Zooshikella ganghwensis]|uniref:substrate-binding periplasmic protein n=1 Tax=Zooshikella ganghwensis TaxID=202772 RepID=UPI0003F4DB1B|nr:transporter substrate-binding domain-containing protein [Zooshikella ganghwensis]
MKRHLIFLVAILILNVKCGVVAEELVFNTQDFPPFNYTVDNKVEGPAADIIRAACQALSYSCKFKLLPWRRAINEVKEGKAHGLFVIGWNKERDQWLYYSPPLMETAYGFFVRKSNTLNYSGLKDIEGYRVGVFGPSNTSKSLEKIKQSMESESLNAIHIKMVSDDINIFKMLDDPKRNLTSVYSNKDVGMAIIHQVNLGNIRYAGSHKKLNYYFGLSKEFTDKKVADAFSNTVSDMRNSGKLKEILDSYHMRLAPIDK